MSRCLDLCQDQPLLGSATTSHWLVVVDQLRPWPAKIQKGLSLPDYWQTRIDGWRSANVAFTLVARHSAAGMIHCFSWDRGRVTDNEGQPVGEKWLVCTHGSRDACCGSSGPRLAQALREAGWGEVWEISHIGGHRFAPTLWHLPSWRIYGRLAWGKPLLDLSSLRGHAAYSARLQVMEAYLFQQRGIWPLWLEESSQGCQVFWADGQEESWIFTLQAREYLGPHSCRDIPDSRFETYLSWSVLAAARQRK